MMPLNAFVVFRRQNSENNPFAVPHQGTRAGEQVPDSSSAFQTAALMDFLDEDITDCAVNCLAPSHFYKTMAAERQAGLTQDVYKITYEGRRVYLKLQINQSGLAVIISFKEDESFG
jgi:hypothetical protein